MPKIHRHVVTSTIQPPRNGATAPAMPPRPDQAPIARPRSVPLNVDWMIASDPGVSSAPPTPWNARAALSTPIVGATAHSSDATANQTTPTRNTRRRPNRSPERAAQQQERGERQGVGVDGPLQVRGAGVEVLGDRRQRDRDDGGVDERDRGPEDGREQDPAPPAGGVDDGARGLSGGGHGPCSAARAWARRASSGTRAGTAGRPRPRRRSCRSASSSSDSIEYRGAACATSAANRSPTSANRAGIVVHVEVVRVHVRDLVPAQRRRHRGARVGADRVRRGDGAVAGHLVVVDEDLLRRAPPSTTSW